MSQVIQTKLVFLGEAAVGKSSIVLRFVKEEFNENSESTIGAAFLTAQIQISENHTIKYEIWDTAGQERFHSLAPMYYRGAQAAIIVYDITSINSFERAKSWVQELHEKGSPNVIICLAGNKCDLLNARKVETEVAQNYADKNGLIFMECSAKSGINIKEMFTKIAKRMPRNSTSNNNNDNSNKVKPNLNERKQAPPEESGCC
eukprot:TRINITY_DN44878_c0_g1_i1.p1 TRINITY_DN44878_c0_g1~~TRINITY_DN44878_c0_g1_i1.p1  ORF type:complete len:203 (-),score=38.83 TRINITY_DN44878_c0_g1_i1:66-674(-)